MRATDWLDDPHTAIEHLKELHGKKFVAADKEEWDLFAKGYPDEARKISMPPFVVDMLGHFRFLTSGEFAKQENQKYFAMFIEGLPIEYVRALMEYIKRYPMDTPLEGEVHSSS